MSVENLKNAEAIQKIKDLVDAIDIAMLSTYSKSESYPCSVPMSRQEVDDEGNIWFLFSTDSTTFENLQVDKRITLNFAHVGDYKFLNINGTAEISTDQARIDKYWSKFNEAWFEKGKEDPAIRIMKVIPEEAHYWDNKTNKLATLLKVATSAISGKKMDIGREGDIEI